jgi:hypothetical protein
LAFAALPDLLCVFDLALCVDMPGCFPLREPRM